MKTDKLQLQRLAQGLLGPVTALTEENKKEQLIKILESAQEFTSAIRAAIHEINN